jgi:hypothetical protein
VTSALLSLDGGRLAAATNLDVLVPVGGYRRCLDTQNGFTFLYPARWLADQTLYRRYAARVEREAALDPPSLRGERARRRGSPEPAAAYGPPGSTGAVPGWAVVGEGGFRFECVAVLASLCCPACLPALRTPDKPRLPSPAACSGCCQLGAR